MCGDSRTLLGHAAAGQILPGDHRFSLGHFQPEDVPGGPAAVRSVYLHDHFQQPLSEICRRGFLHRGAFTDHSFQRGVFLHHPEANHLPASPDVLWHHYRSVNPNVLSELRLFSSLVMFKKEKKRSTY